MRSFDELLRESAALHGHCCAGQVLGVRMAMAGCREAGIDEPRGCKKLIVYVEIDRCATDAVQSVTGCSLGKRTLKFLDYGKMAASFLNTESGKAIRVLARDDARSLAARYVPDAATPREAQKQAYALMPESALFSIGPARIDIADRDKPGFRSARVYCEECGEGINLRREVNAGGRRLCVPCARSLTTDSGRAPRSPRVLLVAGVKKSGKTTLIEKLVAELSARGYCVGTIKHHHSEVPASLDVPGTDTWRHRKAGACSVALLAPDQVALVRDVAAGDSLDRMLANFQQTDIVLAEGFHGEPSAKIEVLLDGAERRVSPGDRHLIALVGNSRTEDAVPFYAPGAVAPLADLIEREMLKNEEPNNPSVFNETSAQKRSC